MIIACLLNPFDVRGGAQNIRRVWTDDFVRSGAAAAESRRVSDSESWQSPGCWADSGLLTCPVLSQGAHIPFLTLGGLAFISPDWAVGYSCGVENSTHLHKMSVK